MIVWLASYPRSGNTFFRIVLNQLYGIKTTSIYNELSFFKDNKVNNIIGHVKNELTFEDMVKDREYFFIKTH